MIKTVELTGSEVKVTDLGGQNAAVKNLGSGSIYVSTKPNITAGADNVIEIPAGAGEVVLDANGTVYIVGTGKVQCTGTPYATPNFKLPSSSSGGGGGTSDVTKEYVDAQDTTNLNLAKAYTDNAKSEIQTTIDTVNDTLNAHIADQVKHITAEERAAWNAKAETNIATTTADGLMSAADKEKLDGVAANANKYSLPLATASVRGGVKIGYEENGKNYPVELANEKMFVNVPWENTTYSEATTSAAGLMSAADKSSLDDHIADQVKHITAEERAKWDAVNYSNPNLLINPDFKINQRGQDVYSGMTYTADCWKCISSTGQVTVGSGGITVTSAGKECKIQNYVEGDLTGKTITLSACIDGTVCKVSGIATTDMTTWNKQLKVLFDGGYLLFGAYQGPAFFIMLTVGAEKSISCQWVKLELGSIATPFFPPDPATELAKCQRYYQIRSTNDIDPVDLRPSMRATPTDIKKVTGGYAYVAEL